MFRAMTIPAAATLAAAMAMGGCETAPGHTGGGDRHGPMGGDMDPRAAYGPTHHIMLAADDIEFEPGPGSLAEGAEYAVLEGDPSADGLFTMRLRLPDGFRIKPHTHPNVERVTVLSGTFHLGEGPRFNEDRMHRLEAGSYTSMPPGMQHYAQAEGETVVELTSIGPWDIHYIDPAHDPRR